MESLLDPTLIASFISLSALEIILGIDNLIFIALIVQHLPENQQKKARNIGLSLALVLRITMLLGIVWIIELKEPLITLFGKSFSGKDLLMFSGGLFLIYKATDGIHEEISHEKKEEYKSYSGAFLATIFQIVLIDLVFSFDSIMTAVGITHNSFVIIAAMLVAIFVMLLAASTITRFIKTYPTLKMLALSFVMLIGLLLASEAFGVHVPKGYIYAAMAFSLSVEVLNITRSKKRKQSPFIES